MIATRREFMKLSVALTAGMVLRPAAKAEGALRDLFEGVECPVPFEVGGDLFLQFLGSGDSILGPVLIYKWDVPSQGGLTAELVRPDQQLALIRVTVQPGCNYRWQGTPGAEIMVPERGEVVFKCSSPKGVGAVCFEKLT